MPNKYVEQVYTDRTAQSEQDWQDNTDIDYIFANEDAEADVANLVGSSDLSNAQKERRINPLGYMGKINKIFQVIFNRLNWLKAHAGGNIDKATDAQSAAALDTEKYVPPSGLRAFLRGSIAAATTTYRGAVERLTNTEARLGTDTTRYPSIASILDALRFGSPFRASTSRYGVVQTATKSDVANNQNTERVLTVDSVYREITNTHIQPNHLVVVSQIFATFTRSLSVGREKYFGPVLYERSVLTITGTASTRSSSANFKLNITSVTLSDYNWTFSVNRGRATFRVENDGLQVDFMSTDGSFQYTITGTPN